MRIFIFFLTVFFLTADAHANLVYLQQKYGQNLKSVDFAIRQSYLNSSGKTWADASVEERQEFLNKMEEKAKQRQQDKIASDREKRQQVKNKESQKRAIERSKKERDRARGQLLRQRQRQDSQQKRDFQRKIAQQKRMIQRMRSRK